MGITADAIPSLQAWAESLGGVGFPLCSDFWPHGAVTRAYGVLDEARGRPERAILIVDERGVVRYIDVHLRGEVPEEGPVLDALASLG